MLCYASLVNFTAGNGSTNERQKFMNLKIVCCTSRLRNFKQLGNALGPNWKTFENDLEPGSGSEVS